MVTLLAKATELAAEPTDTPMPAPTAAPRETSTPTINTTATAQSAATLVALNALEETQRNWPVLLQEKFSQPELGWNDGTNNDEYALEEISIANNKYTWKVTSKKSMGSLGFGGVGPRI